MINKITIHNYKSVVDASFPLSSFNVIIGANGSGKSNVLEAIALAAASSSDKLDYEYFSNRGIRVVDPQMMLPAFEDIDAQVIQVEVCEDDNETKSEFKIRYNKDAKPPRWEDSCINARQFINLLEENNVKNVGELKQVIQKLEEDDTINITLEERDSRVFIRPSCKELSNFTIYSIEESVLRKADNDSRLYPLGRHGEGLFAYLKYLSTRSDSTDIIKEINSNLVVFDWFDGIEFPNSQLSNEYKIKLHDSYVNEALTFFDQRSTNEGFLYLLFYLTLIISDETPSFFAIENIDASFNPKLCREVIRRLTVLAKIHNKQIIATTHNPTVLDGLDIQSDDQSLLVARRNIDGYTKVNKIESKGKLNMSLSDAWKMGYFGGLPDNF